ncbi:MAG: diaminopimelate decarboxylase [Desulfovibrio sp.]|jgi:diaminopimelate decarboxylase|nr:diaminopimelate decarboxylase [Desulfovibrio sp.]
MTLTRNHDIPDADFFGRSTPEELTENFGSPLYVYNENILRARCRALKALSADPGFKVCYSTKANGNPHLLRIIREEGLAADAMSPGEIAVLRRAGFPRKDICYVCNNVSRDELALACREADHVSVDSVSQMESFGQVNPGGEIMIRVNPGIGAGHHDKVITAGKNTKFGIVPDDFDAARDVLRKYRLTLIGLNQHVGSLFMDPKPYLDAAAWLLRTAERFPGIRLIDFGGGFGIPYRRHEGEKAPNMRAFGQKFDALLDAFRARTDYAGAFLIEPGRYVTAECSVLLGRVHAVKNNGPVRYVGTDIGFNVLVRPVMYDAFHEVVVYGRQGGGAPGPERPGGESCFPAAYVQERPLMTQTIVGNICETGDVSARDRELPEAAVGDVVGVLDAGAYGQAMSSNYNQRLRPAEVLIAADGSCRLIRRRDTVEDLLAVYPE